jgi:PAS domain S-box-containing protein
VRIRSSLYLAAAFPVVVGLILAAVVLQAASRLQYVTRQARTIGGAMREAFSLEVLLSDYLLHHSDRARDQWLGQHKELGERLATLPAPSASARETVEAMVADHRDVRVLFLELTSLPIEGAGGNAWQDRLMGQLTAKLDRMVRSATRLDDQIHDELSAVERHSALTMLAFVLALALGQWCIASATGGSIVRSLNRLRAGTQAVGSGALDHRVDAAGNDELSELARAFNDMTGRLGEITASRDELDREVAGRKKTEALLSESEAKYRSLFDTIPQKMFYKDTDSVYRAVNPAFARDFRLEPADFVGKTDLDLFPADLAAKYREDDRSILETGERLEVDEVFVQGGVSQAVHTIKTPVRDRAGRIVGLLGIFWDITERKQAEQELKESERRLRTLQENVQLIAVTLDTEGTILFCNDYCLALTGWRRDEVLGRNWFDIFVPPQLGVREMFHDTLIKGALPAHYENPILTRNGRELHIVWSNSVFTNRGGPIIGVTSLGVDVTEQRNVEGQLRRALQELERSNKELEQFAYVASHDLQEPLRTVGSFAELVSQRYAGKLDKDGNEFLGFMIDSARRAQHLINDLLQYSRVGSRAKPFELIHVEEVLALAIDNLRTSIEEGGAVVTHDPMPSLRADPTQMLQLLQNLVGNAVKFRRPEEPCRVHVSCREEPDRWVFTVRDNGIGIAPQYFERIFVIFQRLHSRGKYPGTGIGLAVCKKIVERHGGRIWVESEPGRGSSFHFSIPRKPRDSSEEFVLGESPGHGTLAREGDSP